MIHELGWRLSLDSVENSLGLNLGGVEDKISWETVQNVKEQMPNEILSPNL